MSTSELIIYLLSNALRIYSISKLISSFLGKAKSNRGVLTAGYVLFFVLNSFVYLQFRMPVLTIISNVIPMFLLSLFYDKRIYSNMIATFLTFTLCMMTEAMLCVFLDDSIIISSGLASSLLHFLIALLIENYYHDRKIQQMRLSVAAGISIVPIGSIIIGAMTMTEYTTSTVIEAVCLLIINVTVFYLYGELNEMHEETQKSLLMKQQNNNYMKQLQLLTQSNERLSYFRHDMKNHLQQIQNMIVEERYADLSQYVKEASEYLDTREQFISTDNSYIDSIVNNKLGEASKLNAKIMTNFQLPSDLNVDAFDINIILGNLLDNAIDALKLCKERMIFVSLSYDKGVLFIDIENSCEHEPQLIDGEPITTKTERNDLHGLGLRSIKEILKKYDGSISFSFENQVFSTCILMYI